MAHGLPEPCRSGAHPLRAPQHYCSPVTRAAGGGALSAFPPTEGEPSGGVARACHEVLPPGGPQRLRLSPACRMSEKDCDNESCSSLNVPDFKNALKEFQKLVEKTVAQKTEERLGLYIKDGLLDKLQCRGNSSQSIIGRVATSPSHHFCDVSCDLLKHKNDEFCKSDFLMKRVQNFVYFIGESGAVSSQGQEENMVFLVSEKQQITHPVVKRRDVTKSIVKVPHLDFTVTSSQKGVLTIFNNQSCSGEFPVPLPEFEFSAEYMEFMRRWFKICILTTDKITGCDFLTQMECVVAVTERTIIVWDYKSKGSQNNCFIIKPMENGLLCVCTVTMSDHLADDNIIMGDDKGYVHLLKVTGDHFGVKCKGEKESQIQILDSKNFNIVKCKLYDDWVGKVKYISDLNCFGSCSSDSIHSFVLDDIKRLEDSLPVKEFSVPKGVNAFTYCGKAKVIVTGGHDKFLHLWHPCINSRPTGKLSGHRHGVLVVTNEKHQYVISLSSAKLFVWNIQTLSMLQVFHDNQGIPGELETLAMVFDNDCGTLIAGSTVIDIYPLTHMIQDMKQVPQTHEKSISVLAYNRTFHQVLTICSQSILKVIWDLEAGYQIYQIEDAHGLNIEVTCAAIEINVFYLATWFKEREINENSQASIPQASGNVVLFLVRSASSSRFSFLEEGCIMCWSIVSFLTDPQNSKRKIKELCWRAHSTEVVGLFHEEEKNVVVTASVDGSVRLWHATNECYLGYFRQPRKFELSDISLLILPCDVNSFPIIIKEESHMENKKKFEYPLMLDMDRWKSLTRSPSISKHVDIIQDLKFFKALAFPKGSHEIRLQENPESVWISL
ncbi:LOW QUALITY PROTEIN: WD repeat-containing protein 64 [Mergus octosetaceus]